LLLARKAAHCLFLLEELFLKRYLITILSKGNAQNSAVLLRSPKFPAGSQVYALYTARGTGDIVR